MRVFIFLLAVLVPMMATAAERSDSPETRLRLVEIELENLKDSAKDEATRVEALEGQGKLSAEAQKRREECRRKLTELEKQMAKKGEI